MASDEATSKHVYRVLVDDNFHYMDASERYELRYEQGGFDSCEDAIAACKKIVDDFLLSSHKPPMIWEELWELYTAFGDDPFIVPYNADCSFSAWDYAKERCKELCR
jgi:hypothetical protein